MEDNSFNGSPAVASAEVGRGRGNRTPSRGFGDRWFTVNRYPYEAYYTFKMILNQTSEGRKLGDFSVLVSINVP
jgi:hypothetical protein